MADCSDEHFLEDDRDDSPEEYTDTPKGRDALYKWAERCYDEDRD